MLAAGTVPIARAAFEGEERAGRGRARGRPAGAADARLQRPRRRGGDGQGRRRRRSRIDTKLDGIRIQVHRAGDDVVIATRSLDVITDRLPEVVEVVRALPGRAVRARRRGDRPRRRRPAPAVPGDRVTHGHGERRPGDAVLLRPAPPRRHQPARPSRHRALGGARRRSSRPSTARPASSPTTPTPPRRSCSRRSPSATRAWS